MAGCEIYAITGIDGDQRVGEHLLEPLGDIVHFLPYDRSVSFAKNAKTMRDKIISENSATVMLLGWSIGGAMALYLGNLENCTKCISINSFFHRSQYLLTRNISIHDDDDICIDRIGLRAKNILIIAGGGTKKSRTQTAFKYTNALRMPTM